MMIREWNFLREISKFEFKLDMNDLTSVMATLKIESKIIQRIRTLQQSDPEIIKVRKEIVEGKKPDFQVSEDGIVRFRVHLYVPDNEGLRNKILSKAHRSNYSIYPRNTKMYRNLHKQYWCNGMKVNIAKHISRCLTCQQV